jgi:hypothetical protein
MAFELNDLLSNQKWVPVEYGGEVLNVAYRPVATSMRKQAELQQAFKNMQKAAAEGESELVQVDRAAALFCEIVSGWDMTMHGQPIPVTAETASLLPQTLFTAIMDAVLGDGKEAQEEKKESKLISAAGSPQEGEWETSLNGTRSLEPRGTWA